MNRIVNYKYELLNKTNNKIGELECLDGNLTMKSDTKIKYSGQFQIKENEGKDVDYLNDRIRPILIIDDIEYKFPIFLISSPKRLKNKNGIIRDITGYDLTQILLEDCLTETLFVKEGTRYKDIISRLINSSNLIDINLKSIDAEITRDREFEIGKSKLDIINNLLKEINYTDLYVDNSIMLTAKPYIFPHLRATDHIFTSENSTIINSNIVDEIDLFNIPNVFLGIFSSPEKEPISVKYVNDNPTNKLSTISRSRKVVKVENLQDVWDKRAAEAYIKRVAYENTNVFRTLEFETLNFPNHGINDCLLFINDDLNINGKYIEKSWNIILKQGGTMKHTAQKIELLI